MTHEVSKPAVTTIPAVGTEDAASGGRVLFIVGVHGAPHFVELGAPCVLFGRDRDCDVRLATDQASRQHAEIARIGPIYVLRDLGSTNGTLLNGARIQEAPLVAGNVVQLGDWVGVVIELGRDEPRMFEFAEHAPSLWGTGKLRAALAPAKRAARSDLPIIIEGETGTGKELVARAVHAWSDRSGPFVAVNCAALPETLVEAELFGYRRGAFTGAERASLGHIRSAEGGTLLLDEICELSLATQGKLLRVLEQREVVPIGESKPLAIDVRVLSAAQEPLQLAVEQQRFRADLYARLDGLTVRLPPLRERRQDIPQLVSHFMRECSQQQAPSLSAKCVSALVTYDWPFNVRELRSLSRRLVVLHADLRTLEPRHLPDYLQRARTAPQLTAVEASVPDAGAELERFLNALREHSGNVTRAARAAGISRMRAYRLMNATPDIRADDYRRPTPDADP